MIAHKGKYPKSQKCTELMRPSVYGRTESEGRTHIAALLIDEAVTLMEGLRPHAILKCIEVHCV